MTTAERERVIALPRRHAAQQRVVREAARFNVLACGRRWGKTTLGVDLLVPPALEGYPVAWFAPTYKMLTEVWREVRRVFLSATERVNAQEHRLELVTGGVVDMWSLDTPNTARGRRYRRIVADEAAMVADLEDAWNAVLRPTLVDFKGDAWFLSTPKGYGFFRSLYDAGQNGDRPDWASWQMPTTSNPHIDPQEVEAARLMLPERTFAQEFLAQFLEDGGGVFRRVRDAATATAQDRKVEGHRYVVGVDWGKLQDFNVSAVVDATTRELVALDRSNKVDYAVQLGRLTALCERFKPDRLIAEQNSMGEPLIEQLQRSGLPVWPFQTTNASKASVIDALALAFERGDLRILDDQILLGELLAYQAERLPSGLLRYGAPAGMHDDCVIALALAWSGASAPKTEVF
jgi:phage terminase large subunit-like protein